MEDLFLKQFAEALERSEEICMTDEFRSYQEWDSLAILSLLASIDEEYSVNINSAELEKMKTVGDVCKCVLDKS
jgi:acyl carrier protein|tara:strand:- start:74 stop:295 length:222 start_codon:yes stop_codon:yes gene_type:complete